MPDMNRRKVLGAFVAVPVAAVVPKPVIDAVTQRPIRIPLGLKDAQRLQNAIRDAWLRELMRRNHFRTNV